MSAILEQPRLNRIILYPALAGLLLLGLWLRLAFIHTVQLYPDEFVTLLAVRMIRQTGLPVMPSGLFYEHGLLFSYAGSLAALLGPARLAVRTTSLVFGLLTVGLTFYLGRRWFSPAVGLLAAAALVISPAAIQWSGRARMYSLLQLLVLLVLWLAYEGLARRSAGRRWLALLAYLGAALTHFVSVTLAPPLFLVALVFAWRRRSHTAGSEAGGNGVPFPARSPAPWPWKKYGGIGAQLLAFLLILAAAFLLKRAGQPKGIEAMDTANALPGLAQVFALYSNFTLNPAAGWQAIAPFYLALPAVIFAPFALIGLAAGWPSSGRSSSGRPEQGPAVFLAFILLLTTLEMILFVSPDRRDDKYLFMLLPVLLLLGGQGLVMAANWLVAAGRQMLAPGSRPPAFSAALVHPGIQPAFPVSLLPVLLSGLVLVAAWPGVQALLANTGDDYDTAFAYVREKWRPGDTVLTGSPAAAAFYLGRNDFYAVQRQGGYDYRILMGNGRAVDRWLASPAIRTEAELHEVLANHRVWLVLERWGLQREYYDLPFQQQLLAQAEPVDEVRAQGIFVLRSQPNPRPLVMMPTRPVEANFAGLVRLTGYTPEPESPAPGRALRLTLYWRPLASLPHDYTVFVHLRRPDGGGNVTQADHRPLGEFFPTTFWPAGQLIRESSELFLPSDLPAGEYDLWVGLYRLETGERLPVQDDRSGENAVRLGELVVNQND